MTIGLHEQLQRVTGDVTESVTDSVTGVVTRSVTPRIVFRGRAVNYTGGRHAPIDTVIFTTMSVYELSLIHI